MDNANRRFCEALSRVNKERERVGIGMQGEKTLHLALKYYYEENELFHEKKIGRFFADIANEEQIFEIQTAGFQNLKKKLDLFLGLSQVCVVYPVPYIKELVWIDEETGEMTKPRKTPKKGNVYKALCEIPKLTEFLEHPGFSFRVILLNMTEYRRLNGWDKTKKKGSTRFERIPTSVAYEYCFENIADYKELVPSSLPVRFLSKEFKKATGLSTRDTGFALLMLVKLGLLERVDKQGKAYVYERNTTE